MAVIRGTLDQGKPLTPNQQADLVFAPIMGRAKRSQADLCHDALDQALRIADEADQQKAMGSILALAYHVLERTDFEKLMEVVTMHSDVLDRVYRAQEAKGLKQGIEQGRVEAEQRDILRVLAIRLGAVHEEMAARVAQVSDSQRLAVLLESAATARTLAEFERTLE